MKYDVLTKPTKMKTSQLQDKCRGAIVAGAAGDALGYAVEFISLDEILRKYGTDGITAYDLDRNGVAEFSDDTQMSLYTAEGLMEAVRNHQPAITAIRNAYLIWYGHQAGKKVKAAYNSELSGIKELNQQRAPGNTCMSALYSEYSGKKAHNSSKGCGGVMRVAPIGLYGAGNGLRPAETARLAGDVAMITHLHPLSTYSSAALAVIVQLCTLSTTVSDATEFKAIIRQTTDIVSGLYGDDAPSMNDFKSIISKAVRLSDSPEADSEIIENRLGGGWVAEETLAIAIFSVLRHTGDFDACLICAVNHSGDSDSTGAVAGNILGSIVGYDAIPQKYKTNLELSDLLIDMADRL